MAAIAATAAQVLAAQAQSAGSVQPMNSSSGSMLISGPILNINFGGQSNAEIGPAAVGCSSTDYWNAGYIPSYVYCTAFSNLLWSSGQPSGINVAISGAQGDWGNGTSYDAMFSSYIYVPNGAITVTLTGVPQGTYDSVLLWTRSNDGLFRLFRHESVQQPRHSIHQHDHELAILNLDPGGSIEPGLGFPG